MSIPGDRKFSGTFEDMSPEEMVYNRLPKMVYGALACMLCVGFAIWMLSAAVISPQAHNTWLFMLSAGVGLLLMLWVQMHFFGIISFTQRMLWLAGAAVILLFLSALVMATMLAVFPGTISLGHLHKTFAAGCVSTMFYFGIGLFFDRE